MLSIQAALDADRNAAVFFHGTDPGTLPKIISGGFREPSLSGSLVMLIVIVIVSDRQMFLASYSSSSAPPLPPP